MKSNVIAIIAAAVIIGAAFMFATRAPQVASTDNVYMENGKQIVEITAKGKYTPQLTAAKAGVPTVLRMKTNGTYDCTMALKVPSVGYQNYLPNSGTTDIEVPAKAAGETMQGICSMGMYNFEIRFN